MNIKYDCDREYMQDSQSVTGFDPCCSAAVTIS